MEIDASGGVWLVEGSVQVEEDTYHGVTVVDGSGVEYRRYIPRIVLEGTTIRHRNLDRVRRSPALRRAPRWTYLG